ncbi:protein kinase family protein [Nocardiopsis salina]|uniref:protein kinase family protein n=1 Tax=Nocardiopsis salina TaxID=245836 RepID=UPI0003450A61|nr:protein kinase family protein [Nocardiopsis salina]
MHPLHPHDPPRVGPYQLHARLSEDTGTRTYLASAPGRPVTALVVARPSLAADPGSRAAFTRRVAAARGAHSPWVAPVLDGDTDRATPWVAVARPSGPSLSEFVDGSGALPVRALHPLALALAQGLADLHSSGRTHGSVRPGRVLLTAHAAVLADPGLALPAAGPDGHTAGDVSAAPEGGGGPAADVFALAATLCFAASGVEGPDGLERVPPELRALVDACLLQGPDLRPGAQDLVRMLGGPAVPGPWPAGVAAAVTRSAEAVGRLLPGETTAAPARRRRRPSPLWGAALLALVCAAGITLWAVPGAGDAPDPDADCLGATGFDAPAEGIGDLDAMATAFSPDGDLLAVTSNNHGLTLWDWREGEEIARPVSDLHEDGNPVFSPVGCTLAVLTPQERGGDHPLIGAATVVDVPSGTLSEHDGPQRDASAPDTGVGSVSFAPDGSHMALGMRMARSPLGGAASIGLVDLADGEATAAWGSALVEDLAHLDDGTLLALDAEGITVWDPEEEEALVTEQGSASTHLTPVPGGDEFLHVRNGRLIRWNLEERTEVASVALEEFLAADGAELAHVELDPSGERVHVAWAAPDEGEEAWDDPEFSGRDAEHRAHLWEPRAGGTLSDEEDLPRPVSHHPDGEVAAAITPDGGVDLVDPDTHEPVRPLQ